MIRTSSVLVLLALVSTLGLGGCAADSADDSTPPTNDGADEEIKSRAARFETFEGISGKQYFHVLAGNGELILRSQAYASRQAADKGISSVLENAVDRAHFVVKQTRAGDWYFTLKAGNSEIIGTSEAYASKANAERGADTVQRLVKKAVRQSTLANAGAKVETLSGLDGQSYFHVRAANGEIVLQSEGYSDAAKAKNGIEAMRLNGRDASKFEVLDAGDGQFYFRLKAANGEIIGRGETYTSKSDAERGASTVVSVLKAEVPVTRAQ